MSNENKKDFNAMMNNNKDMPKIQIIEDEKTIKRKDYWKKKDIQLFQKVKKYKILC